MKRIDGRHFIRASQIWQAVCDAALAHGETCCEIRVFDDVVFEVRLKRIDGVTYTRRGRPRKDLTGSHQPVVKGEADGKGE